LEKANYNDARQTTHGMRFTRFRVGIEGLLRRFAPRNDSERKRAYARKL